MIFPFFFSGSYDNSWLEPEDFHSGRLCGHSESQSRLHFFGFFNTRCLRPDRPLSDVSGEDHLPLQRASRPSHSARSIANPRTNEANQSNAKGDDPNRCLGCRQPHNKGCKETYQGQPIRRHQLSIGECPSDDTGANDQECYGSGDQSRDSFLRSTQTVPVNSHE